MKRNSPLPLAMPSKLVLTLVIPLLLSSLVVLEFCLSKINPPGHNNIGQPEVIPLSGGAVGPECFVFDSLGEGPYTGVSDGRIIKWVSEEGRWIDFATTSSNREGCEGAHDHTAKEHICGRPLGLRFNETNGDLYIADAYKGLMMVGPKGGVATALATHAQGLPLGFTNGVDMDQSSDALYFADSSLRYQRRNHLSAILSGDKSGRLMKYEAQSKQVSLLLDKLSFPNGVAVSKDGSFILVAETTTCRVLRYWTKTSKAGNVEVFAQLPGFPDNIKPSPRGGYWVAIHSKRGKFLEWALARPWVGNAMLKLSLDGIILEIHAMLGKYRGNGGMGVRLSEDGKIVEIFQGHGLGSISEVMEKDGKLWIGSVSLPFVGTYRVSQE